MRAFQIRRGTEIQVMKLDGSVEAKTMKRDELYEIEDVVIDPLGHVGQGPQDKSIGGEYARGGFYGFNLPANRAGYMVLITKVENVRVV